MKNNKGANKGYTLVELLVAMGIFVIMLLEVYSVMANSSTIYRNGNYEVQLQTEAQQVVLQLEDLMVDCNGSISYDEANKVLSISSNVVDEGTGTITPVVYTIKYVPAGTGTPANMYGQLTYQKTGMTTPIPLADYVEEFSVDMSGYTNDNITLNLAFSNDDYSYTASEDIYLRNEIGSGGSGGADDTSGAKKFLDVKRYATYELSKLYDIKEDGYEYDYKEFYFKDKNGNKTYSSIDGEYKINNTTYDLQIQASFCGQAKFDKEYGPYLIYATGTKKNLVTGAVETLDESNGLLISAHTDPVTWGFNNYSYFYLPGDEPSYKATGLTAFTGISLADAKEVNYSYRIQVPSGYHYDGDSESTQIHAIASGTVDSSDEGDNMPSSQGEKSTVKFYFAPSGTGINGGQWNIIKNSDGSTKGYQPQLPQLYNYIDTTSNAVVTYNGGSVWNKDRCGSIIGDTSGCFLKDGHRFYIQVTVNWDSPASTATYKTYLYPTNRTLSTGEKQLLEDQTK